MRVELRVLALLLWAGIIGSATAQSGLPPPPSWVVDPATGAKPDWAAPGIGEPPADMQSAIEEATGTPAAPAARIAPSPVANKTAGAAKPSSVPATVSITPNDDVGAIIGGLADGSTAIVQPGTYYGCAFVRAGNITIKAAKRGTAKFVGSTCGGKAIFVISGNNAVIDGIEFANARVPDHNGAGIRMEAPYLTVRNSLFRDSEQGILSGVKGGVLLVEGSRFERLGSCEGGCAHGVYVNHLDKLIVRDSVFRAIRRAHHIKSRARETFILDNDLDDTTTGTASYLIDLSNGGSAIIRGNRLAKGPMAENRTCIISIAGEGASNPFSYLVVENNIVSSKLAAGTTFLCNRANYPARLKGNSFTGAITEQKNGGG